MLPNLHVDIRQLRYFVRIVELGSFSRASVDLGIAQSALSYQVREMEAVLQAQLLVRHRQGVSPTEAGRAVLERARVIVGEINALRSEVNASSKFPSGTVTFGAPPTPSRILVPQVVEQFRRQFPHVRLVMREGQSKMVLDWLADGIIDLAILYDFAIGKRTDSFMLMQDSMYLIGAAERPRPSPEATLEDILSQPLVLTSRNYDWRQIIEQRLANHQVRLNISAEVDSLAAIRELVKRGFANTIMPRSVLHPEIMAGQFWAVPLPQLSIPISLNLVRAVSRPVTVSSQQLQRIITEEVGKLEAGLAGLEGVQGDLRA